MDASTFETISRALASRPDRRGLLASAASGLTTLMALRDDAGAAKSGKCKPKCGECEKCKKGDCDKQDGKKRCQKGKCQPKPAGTPCTAFVSGACQNRTCVNLAADEANCGSVGNACGPSQVCQEGSCFPSSTCPASTTSICTPGAVCGGSCECGRSAEGNVLCLENQGFCEPEPGETPSCTTSADCPTGEACVDVSGCCIPVLPAGSKRCLEPCSAPA